MSRKILMIISDKIKTRFMQDADLFEKFKVIAFTMETEIINSFGKKNIEAIKNQFEQNDKYGLVAIYDAKKVYYRDPEIQVISIGNKWIPLDDIFQLNRSS